MSKFRIKCAKIVYKILLWLVKYNRQLITALDYFDDGEINDSLKK